MPSRLFYSSPCLTMHQCLLTLIIYFTLHCLTVGLTFLMHNPHTSICCSFQCLPPYPYNRYMSFFSVRNKVVLTLARTPFHTSTTTCLPLTDLFGLYLHNDNNNAVITTMRPPTGTGTGRQEHGFG